MGAAGSIPPIMESTTNVRRRIAQQPAAILLQHARQIESQRSSRRTSSKINSEVIKIPYICRFCHFDPPELFLTQGDLQFHHDDNHTNHFLKLLDDNTRKGDALIRSLQFLGPGDVIDLSSTCRFLFATCESAELFKPWGKGVYSRIQKTYTTAQRGSTLAKVTGIVMRTSCSQLKRARQQLTSIVEGNRIEYLKIKRPNKTQYTTASAILALIGSNNEDTRASDFDSFRRVRSMMLSHAQMIEIELLNVDILTMPESNVLAARPYIELLKRDLKRYDGLNPKKFDVNKPGERPNRVDCWTKVVATFLIQWNEFWHCSNFAVAANKMNTETMSAFHQASAMLQRLHELAPIWMQHVATMHANIARKSRYFDEESLLLDAKAKERKNHIDRLAAAGFREIDGHWNIHELLSNHGDWKIVLEKLSNNIHRPIPQED